MTSAMVALIYDVTGDASRTDVNAILDGVTGVEQALVGRGHRLERVCVSDGLGPFIQRLERVQPDVVFNLCEGYRGDSAGEPAVASVLELLQLPYTGSGPLALSLALNKPLAKRLFIAEGIPTPACIEVTRLPPSTPSTDSTDYTDLLPQSYPVILKLAREDASLGITSANVVADEAAFLARAASLIHTYGAPVMAETFIDGREFTVPLLDGEPLVLEEIEFDVEPRIVSYASKWEPGTPEFVGTRPQFSPVVGDGARRQMLDLARRVYRLLDLRDYARVDFRLDADSRPFVLEANPNPDITPGSGYCHALEEARVPYAEFLERLLLRALERGAPHTAVPLAAGGEVGRHVQP